MIVRIKKNGGPVHVTITVETVAAMRWWYEYAYEKNQQFQGKGEGSKIDAYALGMPHEIDNDINTWVIALANIGNVQQDFTMRITWNQDGVELSDKWEKTGRIDANSESPSLRDSVWLIAI